MRSVTLNEHQLIQTDGSFAEFNSILPASLAQTLTRMTQIII